MIEVAKPPELAKRGGCWFASGEVQIHLGVEEHFRPAKRRIRRCGARITTHCWLACKQWGPNSAKTTICRECDGVISPTLLETELN